MRLTQQSQRVAARSCFRYALCRDVAGGASHVVDHDRLLQCLGQLLAEQSCDGVRLAARREADNHVDWLIRVGRLRGCTRRNEQRRQTQHEARYPFHCLTVTALGL